MPTNRSRVKPEDRYEYKDKSADKMRHFKASDDEVVVTFDESSPMDGISALRALDDAALYLAVPDAGFAVLRTTDMKAVADRCRRHGRSRIRSP